MDINIISIGNSNGIRLSKTIIEKYKIQDSVELILEEDCIVLKPKKTARNGWEDAFREMHQKDDDNLLIDDVFEDEKFDEWK
jgi:antitoxin MazE